MVNCQDVEFYCRTCKGNTNLEISIQYEKDHKENYIPIKIRQSDGLGIVFTKNSILYKMHVENHSSHDWGKYV